MPFKEIIIELTEIIFGMIYFMMICIPVAITLYFISQIFFSFKNLIKWIRN
jgi:hypothetical protein